MIQETGSEQGDQVGSVRRATDRAVARAFWLLIAILILIRLLSCFTAVQPRIGKPLVQHRDGVPFGAVLTDDGDRVVYESALTVTALLVVVAATILLRRYLRQLRQDERALRESGQFARSIVDALPTHIAIVDETGVVLATNRSWRQYAEASGDKAKLIRNGTNYLVECDAAAGKYSTDAIAFAAGIRAVAAGHRDEFTLEYACHKPSAAGGREDGGIAEGAIAEQQWFIGRVTRFPGPRPARLVISHENITARKRAEEEVRKAKEAAELANLSKSAFLANTSHEIRTPMTAIMGYAEMLLDAGQPPEERMSCARTIRRNGEHLLQIINDILDISKIEAQKVTVEKLACDLPQLVADVVGLTRPWATKKGLEFDVVFDKLIPKQVQTDPLRAKQVLVNLVGNAIKFTAKGRVRISVFRDITYFNHIIRFEVSDSGIGMTPEQMGKLFQPFTQADASTTRRFGGTGLGLTISKRLSKLLGGDITVTSEAGTGSTFSFTLDGGPREGVELLENFTADQLATVGEDEAHDQVQLAGRVLLAEDGEDNQDLLSTHLRKAGVDVVIAGNGRLAVDAVMATRGGGSSNGANGGGRRFDVILMDMQMPELDGYEATRKLRAAGVDVPIIALTANAMAEDRVKCLECGCTEYLSKPISRAHLLHTVGRYLEASRAAHPEEPAEGPNAANGAGAMNGTGATRSGGPRPPSGTLKSTMADEPRIAKLLERFIARLPERVAAMESLLRKQSLDELKHALHQLKGAGGGYGFGAISELAGRAEQRIKQEAAPEWIRKDVEALIELVRSVEGYDRAKETAAAEGALAGSAT